MPLTLSSSKGERAPLGMPALFKFFGKGGHPSRSCLVDPGSTSQGRSAPAAVSRPNSAVSASAHDVGKNEGLGPRLKGRGLGGKTTARVWSGATERFLKNTSLYSKRESSLPCRRDSSYSTFRALHGGIVDATLFIPANAFCVLEYPFDSLCFYRRQPGPTARRF